MSIRVLARAARTSWLQSLSHVSRCNFHSPHAPGTHRLGIREHFRIAPKRDQPSLQPRLRPPITRRIKPRVQALSCRINDAVQLATQSSLQVTRKNSALFSSSHCFRAVLTMFWRTVS